MTSQYKAENELKVPIRLWPGVVIAGLTALARYVVPRIAPEAAFVGFLVGVVGGFAVVVWWLFASRAPRLDRWAGAALIVVALFATPPFLHESVATSGMGTLFFMYAVPALAIAFVLSVAVTRKFSAGARRLTLVATILLACLVWTLFRSPGVRGDGGSDFELRWAETPEEMLLAESAPPTALSSAVLPPAAEAPGVEAEWPGFRGPGRDGVVRGPKIATDWSTVPPVELWRQPIGPGWSSFAVRGNRFYTQEQRGESEVVSCYDIGTGEPLWMHADTERFWEAMAGAGPRGTPTVLDGRVYALGATGILNVLDADTGALIWSRNTASETETPVPGWGIAGSPLVAGDVVVVAVSGRLAAYELATGALRWTALAGLESYSSPHRLVIAGVPQVLLLSGAGASSVNPSDGDLLWEHSWSGFHSLQPAMTADGDVIVASSGTMSGNGLRRLAVTREASGWTVEERWTSRGLKPYFNDFVLHQGHAFGFDGRILASIDLETGDRNWKGGRYGNGQLVLLRDQDLLLVLSDKGEMALVSATPDGFNELARNEALEGKTWNHPALVHDLLLVRNDQEMAAYRLPLDGST